MTKQISSKPNLEIVNGKVSTTSLDVAEKFGKRHDHVLRDIENLDCSQEFSRLNFGEISYKDSYNRLQKAYRITRDGFAILVMGFTGKKAMQWKEKYIAAFNRMEEELKKQWLAAKLKVSRILLSDWDAIKDLMAEAGNGKNSFSKYLHNLGFSIDGPIPDQYQKIPTSRIISFHRLAREGNNWARNLIKRTQQFDVPVAISQSQT